MFDQNTNNEPPEFIKAAMKLKNAVAYESTGKYESALMSLEEALIIQPNNMKKTPEANILQRQFIIFT